MAATDVDERLLLFKAATEVDEKLPLFMTATGQLRVRLHCQVASGVGPCS